MSGSSTTNNCLCSPSKQLNNIVFVCNPQRTRLAPHPPSQQLSHQQIHFDLKKTTITRYLHPKTKKNCAKHWQACNPKNAALITTSFTCQNQQQTIVLFHHPTKHIVFACNPHPTRLDPPPPPPCVSFFYCTGLTSSLVHFDVHSVSHCGTPYIFGSRKTVR